MNDYRKFFPTLSGETSDNHKGLEFYGQVFYALFLRHKTYPGNPWDAIEEMQLYPREAFALGWFIGVIPIGYEVERVEVDRSNSELWTVSISAEQTNVGPKSRKEADRWFWALLVTRFTRDNEKRDKFLRVMHYYLEKKLITITSEEFDVSYFRGENELTKFAEEIARGEIL